MAVAGSLTYDTKLETKGFNNGLSKLGGATSAAFKGVGLAVGATVTAIGGLTVASTNAYAEYEQLVGGVEAMFGGMEKGAEQIAKVQETASTAWKDLTMSQNEYYNSFNSTFPLIKSSIEDQNEAIDTTNRMLSLESDLANTFGYSMEQASNAINWALKGNYSYLDNLNIGIKGTQEGFLEAAHNAGYMVDDLSELSSSDILDILEKTADKFGVLGRTSKEASGTIQGSIKMMKASFSDLLNSLASGEGINEALNNLFTSISAVATNVMPVVMEILKQVPVFISELITVAVEQIPTVINELIPTILNSAITILETLIQGIQDNLDTIVNGAMTIIQTLISGILPLLPQILETGILILIKLIEGISEMLPELIPQMIEAMLLMVETLIDNIDLIIDAGIDLIMGLVEGLVEAMPILIDKMPVLIDKLITAITDNLPKIIEMGIKLLIELGKGIIKGIPDMVKNIPKVIKSLVEGFSNMQEDMKGIGKDLIKGLWNGIKNAKDWVIGKIKGFGESILGGIKDFFGINSPSKVFRDEVGQWLPKGMAVGIEANTDTALNSIDQMNDEIMDKMNQAVNMETARASFSGTSGSVSQILSANSMIQVENYNKLYLDGEEIYENQQTVQQRKNLQYGFGGGTSK